PAATLLGARARNNDAPRSSQREPRPHATRSHRRRNAPTIGCKLCREAPACGPGPRTASSMTSLRAIAAALAVVCAVAFVALWPRDAEVVQWTVADVETNAPQDEAADVTAPDAQRSVVEPDPTAASEADREELQARTITVRGRVVDRFGGPIAGAAVHVELRGGGSERVRRPVTTAADGTFALRGPMRLPRTVRVRASHPEHAPSVVDRPVSEVSDEVVLGDIVLGGGARVRGQVVRGDGSAVAGATVELQPD